MSALVTVADVGFRYRRATAVLAGVSAEFASGQAHAITGPSGCGKSTLLYLIGLMLRPGSGEISLGEQSTAGRSDRELALLRAEMVGFVFQDALLEPSMTVLENTLEGVPLARSTRRYRDVAGEMLERLGVVELRDRKASGLSGGQAQRVALVRAMLKRPPVLLADEPTGNLDDTTATAVLGEMFAYGRQTDCTCIIVTHDERIAAACDSITRLTPVSQ